MTFFCVVLRAARRGSGLVAAGCNASLLIVIAEAIEFFAVELI